VRFERADPAEAASGADVVFLALEHGRSQDAMRSILAAGPRLVIDLAADFRVEDLGLYEPWYGTHRAPDLLPGFTYGLADVLGTSLEGADRIAAPGCFATAALLALRPFAAACRLVGAPVCWAATGSSGSGVRPKPTTHHPTRAHELVGYGRDGHRHEAEIDDRLRDWTGDPGASCRLLPHSAPLVRGIHATLHVRLAEAVEDPVALLRDAWEGSRFVRVSDAPPSLAAVVGTNYAHVHAASRGSGDEVVVWCVIDNLVKGAAGQAVQAMNLALGLDEGDGLGFPGLWPC